MIGTPSFVARQLTCLDWSKHQGGVDKFEAISCDGDGTVNLEMAQDALNAIALLRERPIIRDLHGAVRPAKNDGLDLSVGKIGADDIGIVALVRKECASPLQRACPLTFLKPASSVARLCVFWTFGADRSTAIASVFPQTPANCSFPAFEHLEFRSDR